jgi:RNA polymerase-associated protein
VLTLYSRGDDPGSHWVRIVIAEKALEPRVVEVHPGHPPEDLLDLNPYQSVPTLVDRELVVYEPRIITEYLDERFPHPTMFPNEPVARAQARVALHRIEQDWYGSARAIEASEGRDRQRQRKILVESLLASEALFRVKPWFLADSFSLLDAAVAPILWRLSHWGIDLSGESESLDKYARRIFARPAFQLSLSAAERDMGA